MLLRKNSAIGAGSPWSSQKWSDLGPSVQSTLSSDAIAHHRTLSFHGYRTQGFHDWDGSVASIRPVSHASSGSGKRHTEMSSRLPSITPGQKKGSSGENRAPKYKSKSNKTRATVQDSRGYYPGANRRLPRSHGHHHISMPIKASNGAKHAKTYREWRNLNMRDPRNAERWFQRQNSQDKKRFQEAKQRIIDRSPYYANRHLLASDKYFAWGKHDGIAVRQLAAARWYYKNEFRQTGNAMRRQELTGALWATEHGLITKAIDRNKRRLKQRHDIPLTTRERTILKSDTEYWQRERKDREGRLLVLRKPSPTLRAAWLIFQTWAMPTLDPDPWPASPRKRR